MEYGIVERAVAGIQTSTPGLLLSLSELAGFTALRSLWAWLALFLASLAGVRRLLHRTRNSALRLSTLISPASAIVLREPEHISRSSSISSSISSLDEDDDGEAPSTVREIQIDGDAAVDCLEDMSVGRAVVRTWGEEQVSFGLQDGEVCLGDERRGRATVGRWGLRRRPVEVGRLERDANGLLHVVAEGSPEAVVLDLRNGRWVDRKGDREVFAWNAGGAPAPASQGPRTGRAMGFRAESRSENVSLVASWRREQRHWS